MDTYVETLMKIKALGLGWKLRDGAVRTTPRRRTLSLSSYCPIAALALSKGAKQEEETNYKALIGAFDLLIGIDPAIRRRIVYAADMDVGDPTRDYTQKMYADREVMEEILLGKEKGK